ncbi:uncharacterized protein LOC135840109 [Planococcus citri]|uniref:uncharacterized protein LOC135840109 n=1 Tax=Planococcus citri TaxID=170843 RepID=UPI0031F9FE98
MLHSSYSRSTFYYSIIVLCSLCSLSVNLTYVNSTDIATVFEKVVHMCHRKSYNVSLFDCLKERSLIGIDSIYRSKNDISLVPNFLSLVPNDNYHIEERTGKNLLMDIESQSPQNRSQMLDNLIAGRAFDFLASRSVSIKVPFTTFDVFGFLSNDDNNQTEGRGGSGKKDKGGGLLAMGAMMAGTMMAMKMAAIAAMAGKALMASLMALMLAALASLGKKGGGHSSYEVINVPTHGHHGRRSMQEQQHQQQQQQHYSEEYYNVTPAADEYELPA